MQKIEQMPVEQIERETSVPSREENTVLTNGLHDSLQEMADSFDVSGFKCVKCGLVHSHDTTKHRLSDTFDISESDAAMMEYDSVCHCGIQEAARRGNEVGIDEAEASRKAENAPIPPETSRKMDEELGTPK